jgi:hypothetical protein
MFDRPSDGYNKSYSFCMQVALQRYIKLFVTFHLVLNFEIVKALIIWMCVIVKFLHVWLYDHITYVPQFTNTEVP